MMFSSVEISCDACGFRPADEYTMRMHTTQTGHDAFSDPDLEEAWGGWADPTLVSIYTPEQMENLREIARHMAEDYHAWDEPCEWVPPVIREEQDSGG